MSDFLIYAARLQDAGVEHLSVRLFTAKDRTRMMMVTPHGSYPLQVQERWPARHFELCGTGRLLEQLKDDMLYSDDGVTEEKVRAAINAHPLLREDLNAWFADWLLVREPTEEDIEAVAAEIAEEDTALTVARVKGMLRGLDVARRREAQRADPQPSSHAEPAKSKE